MNSCIYNVYIYTACAYARGARRDIAKSPLHAHTRGRHA